MKQLCAPLFLALCILQTLLATPVQAEFATFSASNLPLAPIQLAQEAIDFIVIRTRSEHSTSKSSSASIGVSYGTSGFNVSARAVQTVFTRIFGEFVIAQRADVGIGPYKTSVNSYCSASFERKANLPQLF